MKLAYILFLQICLLTIPNSYGKGIVNKINGNATTESFFEISSPSKAIFEKAFSDSDQFKFDVLENTSETEKCNSNLPASPFHFDGMDLRVHCLVCTESVKLNSQGLLVRNIAPFRNIPRNILFHSLQIPF
ncbi:hypothetical protein N4T20_14675 [Flavobacterium sp. TR2]|uniref:hypothetical protein n=1 Tax=Flavobacterium sp. TR2 TaxID=2977321 RepID=UPI0021B13B38|nr:hypothetical protein [Flavobacterium sp. TR2]UWY26965.1 hypothetical protein N4T20_14675 [Flavobacterium sp. TR2]